MDSRGPPYRADRNLMNILFLVHRAPHPPDKGDRIRSYQLLRMLSECGDVHLACLADEPVSRESQAELSQLCRQVAIVPIHPRWRYVSAVTSMAKGQTATEGLFRSTRLRQTITGWASQNRFDVIVAYCSSMIPYLQLPALRNIPAIIDLVDVDSQKWIDYAESARWPLRRVLQLEGRRLRRLEKSAIDRATAVTLVSEAEANLFRQFAPDEKVHAIANGVDLDHFVPLDTTHSAAAVLPRRCTFVGTLDYRANIDGLKWFCNQVWPDVRRHAPDCLFSIVGRRPSAEVQRLGNLPGVELVGQVDDVRPHYQQATLTVVPLRVARGIQNKVLEALAMRKAVVSSPSALEGLHVEPDVHVRQASTPKQWIREICRLLDDPTEAARLGAAGRDYVEQHHRWHVRLQEFRDLLISHAPCSPCGKSPLAGSRLNKSAPQTLSNEA